MFRSKMKENVEGIFYGKTIFETIKAVYLIYDYLQLPSITAGHQLISHEEQKGKKKKKENKKKERKRKKKKALVQ